TTNNVHVGYDGFGNITRFGASTSSYDDLADFSSRAPGIFGDPKPELMAIGSYGFTPWIVTYQTVNSPPAENGTASSKHDGAFVLFGGTSMAGPMVAGAAALVIQDMRAQGQTANPFAVKAALMSTAHDLKNDPFVQGSGRVDALAALNLVHGDSGAFS